MRELFNHRVEGKGGGADTTRVLVVDDSALVRQVLNGMLDAAPGTDGINEGNLSERFGVFKPSTGV